MITVEDKLLLDKKCLHCGNSVKAEYCYSLSLRFMNSDGLLTAISPGFKDPRQNGETPTCCAIFHVHCFMEIAGLTYMFEARQ